MRALLCAASVGLLGCADVAVTEAEKWTTRSYLALYDENQEDIGGWKPQELVTRFDDGTAGLTIFTGVSEGQGAPFVVSDVWAHHPQPWVEPVWSPRDAQGVASYGLFNVFPFGDDASFYSPFWRLELLLYPSAPDPQPRSAREVLAAKVDRAPGPMVLCPVVPEGTQVGRVQNADPKDPATGKALVAPKLGTAYVEGSRSLRYLDFGWDRFIADGQNVVAADAYFFVDAHGAHVKAAAVLPAQPLLHPLVNRVEVKLPAGAKVFVPTGRDDLTAALGDLALTPQAIANAAHPELTQRVLLTPGCAEDADFPAACQWLDSAAKVEALPQASRVRTGVQLTAAVLKVAP